jgi:hypothetical protein
MRPAVRAAQLGLAVLLLVVWWFHVIHAPVSDYVGSHFPFPARGSVLVWPAVITQVALIEALVCLPVAVLLALVFRSEAASMAVGLTCVFALRVAVEIVDRDKSRNMQVLGLCHIAAHATCLVGGVVYLKRSLLRWKAVAHEHIART